MPLHEDTSPEVAEKQGQKAARMFASMRKAAAGRRLEEEAVTKPKVDPKILGKAALFCVPVLWGTATPVLRFIYNFANAPNPAELSFIRCLIAVFALAGPTLRNIKKKGGKPT